MDWQSNIGSTFGDQEVQNGPTVQESVTIEKK